MQRHSLLPDIISINPIKPLAEPSHKPEAELVTPCQPLNGFPGDNILIEDRLHSLRTIEQFLRVVHGEVDPRLDRIDRVLQRRQLRGHLAICIKNEPHLPEVLLVGTFVT